MVNSDHLSPNSVQSHWLLYITISQREVRSDTWLAGWWWMGRASLQREDRPSYHHHHHLYSDTLTAKPQIHTQQYVTVSNKLKKSLSLLQAIEWNGDKLLSECVRLLGHAKNKKWTKGKKVRLFYWQTGNRIQFENVSVPDTLKFICFFFKSSDMKLMLDGLIWGFSVKVDVGKRSFSFSVFDQKYINKPRLSPTSQSLPQDGVCSLVEVFSICWGRPWHAAEKMSMRFAAFHGAVSVHFTGQNKLLLDICLFDFIFHSSSVDRFCLIFHDNSMRCGWKHWNQQIFWTTTRSRINRFQKDGWKNTVTIWLATATDISSHYLHLY